MKICENGLNCASDGDCQIGNHCKDFLDGKTKSTRCVPRDDVDDTFYCSLTQKSCETTPCCSGECDAITKRCRPLLPPNCSLSTTPVAKTPSVKVQEAIVATLIFDVTILSASISSVYVPNKDIQGCAVEGSHRANFLAVKIKVSNIGQANYQIPPQQLEPTDCGTKSSFMNMYSVDFAGGPYYKYERCLSDTTEPTIYSCSNMGLSAGNYHVSTLWIEINDTVAKTLPTAGEVVAVNFLPFVADSKTTSSPYPVTIKYFPCSSCSSCGANTFITIPSDVSFIPDYAFNGCSSITTVLIPSTVTGMGVGAFYSCTSLYSISIATTVTAISELSFYSSSSLTSITIPSSVTSIGLHAFYSCTSLSSITIPTSLNTIYGGAFLACISLTSIVIPTSVNFIFNGAFQYCTSLTSISIPTSVDSIKDWTFAYCFSLTSITIPTSLDTIRYDAFRSCTSLSSITIPTSVNTILDWAFVDCTSLASITIPTSMNTIGGHAFESCLSLSSITIPSSVTSIGSYAFLTVLLFPVWSSLVHRQWPVMPLRVILQILVNRIMSSTSTEKW